MKDVKLWDMDRSREERGKYSDRVVIGRGRKKERKRDRERWSDKEISIGKNKEYKKEQIFYMDVLKTIHKKISNQKMKSKERDKSILEYVQCMYNNVHTYKVPGF